MWLHTIYECTLVGNVLHDRHLPLCSAWHAWLGSDELHSQVVACRCTLTHLWYMQVQQEALTQEEVALLQPVAPVQIQLQPPQQTPQVSP